MSEARFGGLVLLAACLLAPGVLGAQGAPVLRLEPADRTSKTGFTRITSVRELADGSVLLTDRQENRLVRIDWESGSITELGRHGEGPGEFQGVGWLYPLGGDRTLFTDAQMLGGRWQLLDGPRIVRTFAAAHPPSVALGAALFGASTGDQVLGVRGVTADNRPLSDMREAADTLIVLLARNPLEEDPPFRIDTIARMRGRSRDGACAVAGRGGRAGSAQPSRGSAPRCNPVASEEQAILFRDGWVALVLTDPYRVDWRSADGQWVRGAPLPVRPVRMDEQERCATLRVGRRDPDTACTREALEAAAWPENLPDFARPLSIAVVASHTPSLYAAPDGRLLIRQHHSVTRPGTRYDVVDRRGVLTGVLALPANEAVVGFGAGHIYTVATDDVDLQWLRRHPWPGGAGQGRGAADH